ncbi:MAG: error-prone DNA polymerase [Gammaproteobacteria bacterium]|nr:error-prone DNA polymerase [Gammaproteobacteria bacterium]MYC26178.1 error-prone DNA polymerase [Gammaproteobacteria bacterium]
MATSLKVQAEQESRHEVRVPFAELHCKSNFSFLQGASHPEELVKRAKELGYEAIAITDECSLSGIVKAHVAAMQQGIKLIVGAEFHLSDGDDEEVVQLVLLAPARKAYAQLSAFITKGRRRGKKGEYELHLHDLEDTVSECFALWIPKALPLETLIAQGQRLRQYLKHLWLALELFLTDDDLMKTANVLTLSMQLELPLVASNDVHMHVPERKALQDTLTAIRLGLPVSQLGTKTFSNAERHLRSYEALTALYAEELLQESLTIARACEFSLNSLRYEYPAELVPAGMTAAEYLRQLTYEGAQQRWPQGMPADVEKLIEKELVLVAELQYEYYFLTVHDIVRFARERDILCQGRGSAANSAICYCLFITEVDPDRIHVLFERFVSKERHEPPDIDVDFEHERREEVIQFIYSKYTRERAALAATLITYRPRSAIRDVGKALGLDLDTVDLLAKSMSWWDKQEEINERLQKLGMDPQARTMQLFIALVNEIIGFPRHLSQHVGGFVISRGPLSELVPVENAAMPDRTVIQWDKEDLEAMHLLKVDVLGLGMLTAIRKTLTLVNEFRGFRGSQQLTVSAIPPEDTKTYEMLHRADSLGVFQVESRAQMSMLPRLKPVCFYDLVIEVAIVRPGPIQGNMVHPYLRRRQQQEEVTYSNDAVRKVLERTLGIPIFQEQVIELAMVAAGFTAGEADQLRRAMAAWQRRGGLEKFQQKLIDGMLQRGHPREFADRIFEQIKGFGEYGFPESHASSFALLVYISAWLKCYEPAAFYCGLLNSLPMGFYSPSQIIQDATRHDLEVRAADVQYSGWDYRLEPCDKALPAYDRPQGAMRVGLRQIKGLGEDIGLRIEANQPYQDIDDLARRAELTTSMLTTLARAGALMSISGNRFQAHWDAAGIAQLPVLWQTVKATEPYHTEVEMPEPSLGESMMSDFNYLGLTLGDHPMKLLRNDPEFRRCITAADLPSVRPGRLVQLAGLITCRQRPSSSVGVVFLLLEDETGNSNIVVWKAVLDSYRAEILQGQLVRIKGIVEREGAVIHVVAGQVADFSQKLATMATRKSHSQKIVQARNFR